MTQLLADAPPGVSRADVEAFSRQRAEPDWLLAARLDAWARYVSLAKPGPLDVGWRRTDLRGLDLERLAAPVQDDEPGDAPGEFASAPGGAGERAGLLALRNGQITRRELDAGLAA